MGGRRETKEKKTKRSASGENYEMLALKSPLEN
jgi:hypothetical protein